MALRFYWEGSDPRRPRIAWGIDQSKGECLWAYAFVDADSLEELAREVPRRLGRRVYLQWRGERRTRPRFLLAGEPLAGADRRIEGSNNILAALAAIRGDWAPALAMAPWSAPTAEELVEAVASWWKRFEGERPLPGLQAARLAAVQAQFAHSARMLELSGRAWHEP